MILSALNMGSIRDLPTILAPEMVLWASKTRRKAKVGVGVFLCLLVGIVLFWTMPMIAYEIPRVAVSDMAAFN